MPKTTFLKLKESKRKILTDAFLNEFAEHTFDEASVSSVVITLGISKGSVYQYFEDKLDLFIHLVEVCSFTKMKYIAHIRRADFPDFWAYFRELHIEGVKFDLENPLQSHFMHNLAGNLNSPSVKALFESLLSQTLAGFEEMIRYEVANGYFREDIPLKTMSYLLYKSGMAIQEQMQAYGIINPRESIKNKLPVYLGKEEAFLQTTDEYIALLKKAFDK